MGVFSVRSIFYYIVFSFLQSPGDSDIEDSDPEGEGMSPDPKEGGASSSATSTKKEDSKSTPPQIYPWMKRVHLGQSKCFFISLQIGDGKHEPHRPFYVLTRKHIGIFQD